jgi:flagellar biosynthesis/type III secretory pathway chaperone
MHKGKLIEANWESIAEKLKQLNFFNLHNRSCS